MIYLGSALAAMWLIGCVAAAIAAAINVYREDSRMVGIIILLIGLPLSLLIGILPFGLLLDGQSPQFTLNKSEWACTSKHSVSTTTFVMSGKVMVPITTTHPVCDNYARAQ